MHAASRPSTSSETGRQTARACRRRQPSNVCHVASSAHILFFAFFGRQKVVAWELSCNSKPVL